MKAIPFVLRSALVRAVLSTLLVVASTAASAQTPHPTPSTSAQLACNLARSRNPSEFRGWWDRVPTSSAYRAWFWNDIAPGRVAGTSCDLEVQTMFWQEAVPGNWSSVAALPGWEWSSGGYFTQTLWLQAIPENWSAVTDIGGWPWSSGGYYTQTFWLRAVPDDWGPRRFSLGRLSSQGYYRYYFWTGAVAKNWGPKSYTLGRLNTQGYYRYWLWQESVPANWAPRAAEPGWPWPTGGYYTQTFWLRAVPENWTAYDGSSEALGRDYYRTTGQGHFRFHFWEHAVPDNWAWQGDRVGGWPWGSGGYYTQFFWWRAVPEDWAPMTGHAIGGIPDQGHYAFWLHHFAAPRGFAMRPGWSVRGSRDASYYLFMMHEMFPALHAEYAHLRRLTSDHLLPTAPSAPVSEWFEPGTSAVVVLTFDTEGIESQSCAVARMLEEESVGATFLLSGSEPGYWISTLADIATSPTWRSCLAPFDIGNHTAHHLGQVGFEMNLPAGQIVFNAADIARQRSELLETQSLVESTFGRTPQSFRAPTCDGHRSFDGSVTSTLSWLAKRAPRFPTGERMLVDSSIATLTRAARDRGIVPPSHLADLSLDRHPHPYAITSGANPILEIPFSYPSDWTGAFLHGLSRSAPPNDTHTGFLVNVWKRNLDEIRAQNGVMVVLAHPWLMGENADTVAALRSFIRYAKSLPGVRFSTLAEVGERFRDR